MRPLISIQYLRAIVALMVIIDHVGIPLKRLGWNGVWPERLASGVDIFFVISGLIMFVVTHNGTISPIVFYRKRILRIVPLYWIITTALVVTVLMFPNIVHSFRLDLYHTLASYLFIPAENPTDGRIMPVLISGWTLNYEMFFYLIFGATLVLPATKRAIVIIGIMVGLAILGVFVPSFYTSNIVIEFAAGVAIGWFYVNGHVLPRWIGWASVVLGFTVIAVYGELAFGLNDNSFTRLVLWGIPAAAIVSGILSAERHGQIRRLRLLHLMGDASYSTYLSQLLSITILANIWIKLGLSDIPYGIVAYIITGIIFASCGGIILYVLLDKTISRYPAKMVEKKA